MLRDRGLRLGTTAWTESPVVDATLLALEENQWARGSLRVSGPARGSRGAEFITEPIPKYRETGCYIGDPDGYIIEVGQSSALKCA
jgi:hypothetical protein